MIPLPKPPRRGAPQEEVEQWTERLHAFVRGSTIYTGDVNATIGSGTTYHGVTALTAPRTLTLPPSASMQDGDFFRVQDESGAANTHNITLLRQGTDTINNGASVTITANYGGRDVYKRGAGKFFSV